jgi:hypothetical protein
LECINEELKSIELEYDSVYKKISSNFTNINLHREIHNIHSRGLLDNINYYDYYAHKYVCNFKNVLNSYLNKILINNNNSVTVIEHLEDDDYIDVLCSHIVFNDYIDCSASNTILECICTNTPIILNRTPATEEYLGVDYPFFTDKLNINYNTECNDVNLTLAEIIECSQYLSNLNTSVFEIQYFLNSLNKIYTKYMNNIINSNINVFNNKYYKYLLYKKNYAS